MNPIIFLDVDGVLNSVSTEERTPVGYIGVEEQFCERLRNILQATNARIVLSSTWRHHPNMLDYLKEKLGPETGAMIVGKTDTIRWGLPRAEEIAAWLRDHPEVKNFAILDDDPTPSSRSALSPRCVLTSFAHGLTDSDAEKAIAILNSK